MLYEQTEPVEYHDGSGQFAGWWYDLQGETAFPAQAPLRFSLYACQTGHPLGKSIVVVGSTVSVLIDSQISLPLLRSASTR